MKHSVTQTLVTRNKFDDIKKEILGETFLVPHFAILYLLT